MNNNFSLDYDYISFDLFDTLIFRKVSNPVDVFDLVGKKSNIKKFKKIRINAEIKARQSTDKEVTLNYIYEYIKLPNDIKEKTMSFENDIEIDVTYPNLEMINLLNDFKNLGKKILITTDMYLPRVTIDAILKKNNINYDYLFLSSEIGVNKYSGKLYKHILEELKIKPNQIIHIGDNYYTDKIQANKYGIKSMCRESYRSMKQSFNFDNNTSLWLESNSSMISNIGENILGPFIYNFCKWIHDKKEELNLNKLVFVSREGYLIKKAYDLMYPNESNDSIYMYLNRNIIRLSLLKINSSLDVFLSTIPNLRNYSIYDILSYLDVDKVDEALHLYQKSSNDEKMIISREFLKTKEFEDFYNKLVKFQNERIQESYQNLIRYLNINNLLESSFVLINNSFNGTIQKSLTKIINNENSNVKLFSFQFELTKNAKHELKDLAYCLFDDYKISKYGKECFYKESRVFEHLLFESAGTAKKIAFEDSEPKIICDNIGLEKRNEYTLFHVQDAVLKYVSNSVNQKGNPKETIKKVLLFLKKPALEEAIICGNIYDKDTDGTSLLIENYDVRKKILIKKIIKGSLDQKWTFGFFVVNEKARKIKFLFKLRMRSIILLKNRW